MPLIHPLSCKCVKSESDLFTVPLTQTIVDEGRWVEYGPITEVKDSDDTIEFKIAETDSEYINLKKKIHLSPCYNCECRWTAIGCHSRYCLGKFLAAYYSR